MSRPLIKRGFKWALRVIGFVAVLVLLLFVFKDSILRSIAERRLRARTGLDATIGKLSTGVLSPVVTLRNLRLYNPPAFGRTPFLVIPELHVEFDRAALARHEFHITLLRLNLGEVDVVKNQAGQTNVINILNRVKKRAARAGGVRKLLRGFHFTGIDSLDLSLGSVNYIDLQNPKNDRETKINLQDQIFHHVKTDADLYGILVVLWLRSGGSLAIKPADFSGRFLGPKSSP